MGFISPFASETSFFSNGKIKPSCYCRKAFYFVGVARLFAPNDRGSRTGLGLTKRKACHSRCSFSVFVLSFAYENKFSKQRKNKARYFRTRLFFCRGGQTRTDDPLVPNQMRYQLRHTPVK